MHTFNSFLDELEKISIDLKMRPTTGIGDGSLGAAYYPPAVLDKNPQLKELAGGKSNLILHRPTTVADIQGALPQLSPDEAASYAKAHGRAVRRHELTHYMRAQQGHLDNYGAPGIRGMLSTGREEAIAYGKMLRPMDKASPKFGPMLAASFGPNMLTSMRNAYPQGLRRAAISGTLSPLVPIAEKLRLIR